MAELPANGLTHLHQNARQYTRISRFVPKTGQQFTPTTLSTASLIVTAKPSNDSSRHDFSEAIAVCVGSDNEGKRNVYVHTSFAIQSSKFFQAALERLKREGARKKHISLDTGVAEFQAYVAWLYTSKITLRQKLYDPERGGDLIRLYILGDYLADDRFCNHVVNTLIRSSVSMEPSRMVFSSATVDLAWQKTTSSSPLRKVLLKLLMCDLGCVCFAPDFEDKGMWSKEVSVNIFKDMTRHSCIVGAVYSATELLTENPDPCAFHRHGKHYPRCSGS